MLRKPRLDPYTLRCEHCWKLGRLVTFMSQAEYQAHLFKHFMNTSFTVYRGPV